MKQRLAGKIVKHQSRYSGEKVQVVMDKCVRSLRKYYMRLYRAGKGISNYYVNQACKPYYMMCEDVENIWNVSHD